MQGDVQDRVKRLQQQLAKWCDGADREQELPELSTGWEALDRLFPRGGVRPGMIVEWLAEHAGSGAGTMAAGLAKRVLHELPGCFVVVDRQGCFYPPGLLALGVDLRKVLALPQLVLVDVEVAVGLDGNAVPL